MDIEILRERIRGGNYLIKSHAVQHAIKEGFERKHIVEVILHGTIIEEYPDDQRALVCGQTAIEENVAVYLHVVCEYTDAVYLEVVTAYIPDELAWESPPLKRRKGKRK